MLLSDSCYKQMTKRRSIFSIHTMIYLICVKKIAIFIFTNIIAHMVHVLCEFYCSGSKLEMDKPVFQIRKKNVYIMYQWFLVKNQSLKDKSWGFDQKSKFDRKPHIEQKLKFDFEKRSLNKRAENQAFKLRNCFNLIKCMLRLKENSRLMYFRKSNKLLNIAVTNQLLI